MLVPKLFTTLKGYQLKDFFSDLNAGAVVAVIALPLSIALGIASGVEPGVALYTAILGCFIVAFLGGSRVQIAGPTGAFVVIVYGIIQNHGMTGLLLATFMGGLIMLFMGLCRFGSLIKFIPYPITLGFTSGIAIVIFSTQIKDFLGLELASGVSVPAHFIQQWGFYFQNFSLINWWGLGISLLSLFILLIWPRFVKKIPGSLIVVVLATFLVTLAKLPIDTIGSRFGEIKLAPAFLNFSEINFDLIKSLILPAITIALLGSIESLLSAVVADGMIGGKHRSNMELVANGIANIATGLTGGIPVTGAIARTTANVKNGGRTPVAGILSAIILLGLALLFLPLIKLIPMSCLAAILVVVAYNMGEWDYFVQFKKIPKSDYFVFFITFLLTIIFDLVIGILVGLIFSCFLFMKRMVDISGVAILQDGNPAAKEENNKGDSALPCYDLPPKTSIYEVHGPFFFGATEKFAKIMGQFKQEDSIIILKMDQVPSIDATGLNALLRFAQDMEKLNCKVILSGLNKQPRKIVFAKGAISAIADTLDEAIALAKESQ